MAEIGSDGQNVKLRKIATFPELVDYLHDELDWPIGTEDFDDLTFDYTPEELGINPDIAAKIVSIKRMRPLVASQPWGVFFVEFDPKRLPVMALRKILNAVITKQRTSATPADRTTWALDDLLFISSYGESELRQISFVHFSRTEGVALPQLKVLGWDNRDTPLHIEDVSDTLARKLTWPDDDSDTALWRETWSSAFTRVHGEVIRTSRELAIVLAELAREIRDRIHSALAVESESGPLRGLMDTFRETLVHDINNETFADMYAQTIAYGLLSARITHPSVGAGSGVGIQLPVTNPFLRELMQEFLHLGEQSSLGEGPAINFDELGVNDVITLLDDADMEAVVRDFGDRNPEEDPVIHFYEYFLNEFDQEQKKRRGVYYTPRQIVSYIVRSVDELLRSEFLLADGLADTATWTEMADRFDHLVIPDGVAPDASFVRILDPATGTGTFLVEIIHVIHETLLAKWREEGHTESDIALLWNEYVPRHLLPRLFGYEILMAPYAVAHLKIGLKLFETGYDFVGDERIGVFLTNALEPATDPSDQLALMVQAMAHEAVAVNKVKADGGFTVVIGNPPYAKNSANRSEAAQALVSDFKVAVRSETNIQPLSDDYVKFLGLAREQLGSHSGLIGMITNRSYLGGLIHRGMREVLLNEFPMISIVDLHGDSNVGEPIPPGLANENVFDIMQGVAISIMSRPPHPTFPMTIRYEEVWGTREQKSAFLSGTARSDCVCTVQPTASYWFFIPIEITREADWVSLDDLFRVKGMGLKTRRDAFLIAWDKPELAARFDSLAEADDVEDVRSDLGVSDNKQWTLKAMQTLVREEGVESALHRILYRPFDERFIWYHPRAIERGDARWPVMQNVLNDGLSLLSSRQTVDAEFTSALVTRGLSEMKAAERTRGSYVFPLYAREREGLFAGEGASSLQPNYDDRHLGKALSERSPTEILAYLYAILYSLSYREKYRSLLRIEFPKIPLNPHSDLAGELISLGSELVSLHLFESEVFQLPLPECVGSAPYAVTTVTYDSARQTVWLDAEKTKGFTGLSEAVWEFEIGGYQVCQKWLKDRQPKGGRKPRPGHVLTNTDIDHYQRIVVAINETIRIMSEIDETIDLHGGWPDAFQVSPGTETVAQ